MAVNYSLFFICKRFSTLTLLSLAMWQVICLLNLKEVFKIKFFKESSNFGMVSLALCPYLKNLFTLHWVRMLNNERIVLTLCLLFCFYWGRIPTRKWCVLWTYTVQKRRESMEPYWEVFFRDDLVKGNLILPSKSKHAK